MSASAREMISSATMRPDLLRVRVRVRVGVRVRVRVTRDGSAVDACVRVHISI